jgi:2-polyprenyl-3-methyl-5-hydroxy-6-metoxy-1,4-benzoquinol methylase
MTARPQSETARRGCDLCGATTARELYTATDRLRNSGERFSIVGCDGCGLLRTFPEMTEVELARFYTEDYWGEDSEPSERWILSSQAEKTRFIKRCGLEGGHILDAGCGAGLFLRALDPGRWDRFGVETGEVAVRMANRALGAGRVFACPLTEAGLDDANFDVVTFWSALEHMNEPRANLLEARRILKPGGTLVVQVPNAASYQARFFGGHWFALDAPRHRYHFTPGTLRSLLRQTGFEVYHATFFSRAHNSHALRQSLKAVLYGSGSPSPGAALFYLSIPFIKPFDWLMSALKQGATLTVAARAV